MIAAHFAHHGVKWIAIDGCDEMLKLFQANTSIGDRPLMQASLVNDDLRTMDFAQLTEVTDGGPWVALFSFVLTSLPDESTLNRLISALPEVTSIIIADIHPLYTAKHPKYNFSVSEQRDFDLTPRAVFPDIFGLILREAGFELKSQRLIRRPEKENPYAFVHTFKSAAAGVASIGSDVVEPTTEPPSDSELSRETLKAEARNYDSIRRTLLNADDERTRQMNAVVNRVRTAAAAAAASAEKCAAAFLRSNAPGDRIVGLALVQGALLTGESANVLRIYKGALSGFEEIQALQTLQAIADRLGTSQRRDAAETLEIKTANAEGRYVREIGPIPLLTDQVLEVMRPSAT
jgi:hypothetical protein